VSAVVELRDVRHAWRAQETLFAFAHFDVAPGERVFLHGRSGSGKSTLLNLVTGVLPAQCGVVRVLGHDLARLRRGARDRLRADHIGFIFQQFNLLPYLDVAANVQLACRLSRRRHERAMGAGGVDAQTRRLLGALGLDADALARQPAWTLSIGQQQRVAAARALIGAPELVVADEPTSALDADTRDAFVHLLLDECRRAGSAVLFVSHDRALAAHFDRTLSLDAA
jgi:putative ABC transport system ATP-binding protein